MFHKFRPLIMLFALTVWCTTALADTTVGDFEALDNQTQVSRLTALTNNTLDKIAAKNPVFALKIQEYFIVPPQGEKYGRGALALEKQIIEYDRIDPQGYTIENAFAKVLSDYLAQTAAATQPAATQSS